MQKRKKVCRGNTGIEVTVNQPPTAASPSPRVEVSEQTLTPEQIRLGATYFHTVLLRDLSMGDTQDIGAGVTTERDFQKMLEGFADPYLTQGIHVTPDLVTRAIGFARAQPKTVEDAVRYMDITGHTKKEAYLSGYEDLAVHTLRERIESYATLFPGNLRMRLKYRRARTEYGSKDMYILWAKQVGPNSEQDGSFRSRFGKLQACLRRSIRVADFAYFFHSEQDKVGTITAKTLCVNAALYTPVAVMLFAGYLNEFKQTNADFTMKVTIEPKCEYDKKALIRQ